MHPLRQARLPITLSLPYLPPTKQKAAAKELDSGELGGRDGTRKAIVRTSMISGFGGGPFTTWQLCVQFSVGLSSQAKILSITCSQTPPS